MGLMEIKTERLVLREFKLDDAKAVRVKINNLNVSRYMNSVPHPYTMKDAEWFIGDCIEKQKEKPRKSYEFAIESRETGEFMGGVGVSGIDYDSGTANLGYWLAEEHWRQGYMTEVVEKLIEFAFRKLKLRRLAIPVFVENKASNGLAKKLGFTLEATKKAEIKAKSTGKIHDTNYWRLLKEEWGEKK